ncbi:MAG TPA: UxaA family hydrolase, partial [Verrucomicrobiota bacterium]|nr:UxaA family hydrolase [Verrucomicrobiota bacterium]
MARYPWDVLPLSQLAIQLHPDDDVVVLKQSVASGAELAGPRGPLTVGQAAGRGHKLAVRALADGAAVRKYGQVIGFARGDIAAGGLVHTHNLILRDVSRDYEFGTDLRTLTPPKSEERREFLGFARPDGRAGTRNYLAVISSVNCSASVAQYVKSQLAPEALRREIPNGDGVNAFNNKS